MSLYTALKLKITTLRNFYAPAVSTISEGFDSILTQFEDSLITQNNILIVRQTILYELITQDSMFIITQDNNVIQAGF